MYGHEDNGKVASAQVLGKETRTLAMSSALLSAHTYAVKNATRTEYVCIPIMQAVLSLTHSITLNHFL